MSEEARLSSLSPPYKIAAPLALSRLQSDYGLSEETAKRVLNIAWEFDNKARPCDGGYVHVFYKGRSAPPSSYHLFILEDHAGRDPEANRIRERKAAGAVSPATAVGYTQEKKLPNSRSRSGITVETGRTAMPPRKGARTAPAAPETEPTEPEQNGTDYSKYLDKDLTATMVDYAEWFEQEVCTFADLADEPERILALGSTLYPRFQKSELNQTRRAARLAAREAEGTEDAEDEAPAKPTARRGTKAASAPASTGPAKPAPRRSRGRATAAAGAEAPY